jgi:hypothetical protein
MGLDKLIDKMSNEEYDARNRDLHDKYDRREKLSLEEENFFCHCSRFRQLLLYPFCIDEFFIRMFLELYDETEQRDHVIFRSLINEWEKTVNTPNHPDLLTEFMSKETREELKSLRKDYYSISQPLSTQEYISRKLHLVAWSRYRYIMVKKIFDIVIKTPEYKLQLNGQDIVFDYFSLAHILTRHYGHIMKAYTTDKSHFSKDIHYEEIHVILEKVFKKIDLSGLYASESIHEINFRYRGIIYKVYCQLTKYNVKGQKASKKFLRLNTFFPVEDARMLAKLVEHFVEKEINDEVSVFVKK